MGLRKKWLSGTGGQPPVIKPLPALLTSPPHLATERPAGLSQKLIEASERLDRQQAGLSTDLQVIDGTWPSGPAWNAAEIDTFQSRLRTFTGRGMSEAEAERMADQSITRDRQNDDRRYCLECRHLQGREGHYLCGNWHQAGICLHSQNKGLAADYVRLPKRCTGFN